MKTKLLRLLTASMCLAWVLTLSMTTTAWAQEKKKIGGIKGSDVTKNLKKLEEKKNPGPQVVAEGDEEEGDEDAEVASARRRYGPNKASAKIGDDDIFLLAGRPDIEKDPGYAAIDSLKTGEIVQITLGQAIKFSTPSNLKFGSLLVKKENVAPNYPGVYSIWMKKTASGWNFVFNERPDIWGTMHKNDADVGETPAKYATLDEPVKSLKFGMETGDGKGLMTISLGKHQWSAAFTIEP